MISFICVLLGLIGVTIGVPQSGYNKYNPNNNRNQYNPLQVKPINRPQQYNPSPAQSRQFVPITSFSNDASPDGSFAYSFSTGDGTQQQATGFLKNAGNKNLEAQVVQGSYSYTGPDGILYTIKYIADENGYRAEGAHLPTPPPIPEAIAKSLQLIAKTQTNQNTGYNQFQNSQQQNFNNNNNNNNNNKYGRY